jgi:hypothetical protein
MLSKVMKPELQEEFMGKTITYFDELTGTAREVKIGQKVIVETPEGILYGGEPFSKLGKQERKNVIEYLEKQGYNKKQINDMIRLRRPQVLESSYFGKGKIIEGGDKQRFDLFGKLETKPIQIETQGIKSKMGEGKVQYIKISGEPVEGGKEGIQLFRSLEEVKSAYLTRKGYPYSKLSQRGKTTETYDVLSGAKQIEPKDLPLVKSRLVKNKKGVYTLELESPRLELLGNKEFDIYRDLSISRKTSPNVRKPEVISSTVLVEKGEPILKVSDETVIELIGMQGGGKTSSQEFFKQLYSTEQKQKVISSAVSNLKKYIPKPKQPIIKPLPILETKTPETFTPLMVGGKGLKTLPYSGTGQYEVQELSATTLTNLPMSKTFIEQKPEVTTRTKTIDILKGFERERVKDIQRPSLNLGFREVVKPREELKVQERLKLNELVKVAERLKQDERMQVKQALSLKTGQKFKQFTIKTPKIKTPFKFEFKEPKIKVSGENDLFGNFKVFVKKKGKEEVLEDTFGTLGEAKVGLKKELIGSLRASGGILRGKEKLSFEDIGIGDMEFRQSKRNKFLVVERKEKRLRKNTTGKQIQVWR